MGEGPTRIYVPGTWMELGELVMVHEAMAKIGEPPVRGPVRGHAVTDGLRAALPDLDDEQLEHYAMTEAAQASLHNFYDEGEPNRRLVLAIDVAAVETVEGGAVSEVRAEWVALPGDVVAWLVDADDAADAVADAVGAIALRSDDADEVLEACLDHELAWYAASELDEVLALS